MQRSLKRSWSFSGLATMVRITLMYYVDFYSFVQSSRERLGNEAEGNSGIASDTISVF